MQGRVLLEAGQTVCRKTPRATLQGWSRTCLGQT